MTLKKLILIIVIVGCPLLVIRHSLATKYEAKWGDIDRIEKDIIEHPEKYSADVLDAMKLIQKHRPNPKERSRSTTKLADRSEERSESKIYYESALRNGASPKDIELYKKFQRATYEFSIAFAKEDRGPVGQGEVLSTTHILPEEERGRLSGAYRGLMKNKFGNLTLSKRGDEYFITRL